VRLCKQVSCVRNTHECVCEHYLGCLHNTHECVCVCLCVYTIWAACARRMSVCVFVCVHFLGCLHKTHECVCVFVCVHYLGCLHKTYECVCVCLCVYTIWAACTRLMSVCVCLCVYTIWAACTRLMSVCVCVYTQVGCLRKTGRGDLTAIPEGDWFCSEECKECKKGISAMVRAFFCVCNQSVLTHNGVTCVCVFVWVCVCAFLCICGKVWLRICMWWGIKRSLF